MNDTITPSLKAKHEAAPSKRRRKGTPRPLGWASGRPIDELAREISARREAGEPTLPLARMLHIEPRIAVLLGDIAYLAHRDDLAPRLAAIAKDAWNRMLDGAREPDLRKMIAPVMQRMWGPGRKGGTIAGRGTREKSRQKRFEHGLAIICANCDCVVDLLIPQLPRDKADTAIADLSAAIRHLQTVKRAIEESQL